VPPLIFIQSLSLFSARRRPSVTTRPRPALGPLDEARLFTAAVRQGGD